MFGRPRMAITGILLALAALAVALLQSPHPSGRELSRVADPVAWFLYPVERNAFARLPSVRGDLQAVAMSSDGQRIIAIGNDGGALVTHNGGDTWAAGPTSNAPFRQSDAALLQSIDLSADGMRGVAVGTGGIRITRDGGKSWTAAAYPTDVTLRGVALSADGRRGVAVGDAGAVLTTSDGGATWARRGLGAPTGLLSVALSEDGMRGVAVGEAILVTADGGVTWQPSRLRASANAVAMTADGQRGIAVGAGENILTTRDGGRTWIERSTGVSRAMSAVAVARDGLRGFAIDWGRGEVLTTADGGASWTAAAVGAGQVGPDGIASSADGSRAAVVGRSGSLSTSDDGGATWVARNRGGNGAIKSAVLTADGERGFALGLAGLINTVDGGRTWTRRRFPDLERLALASDGLYGIAVGAGSTIVTMSGDARWVRVGRPGPVDLRDVAVADDGFKSVAVGEEGTILTTEDGGRTWVARRAAGPDDLNSVALSADGQRGVAVGWQGSVVTTADGGKSWVAGNSGTNQSLVSVALSSAGTTGVAVTWDGAIFTTSDGGKSWTARGIGRPPVRSVALSDDGARGVAVGWFGSIASTVDGGATWTRRQSNTDTDLHSIALSADGLRGIATGTGDVMITNDGGASWQPVRQRQFPAPWLYPVLALSVGLVVAGGARPARRPVPGIADLGITDNPVEHPDEDRLGRAQLAQDLSAFLRNRDTKPPLTLAIIGDWGSGKSSIMRMLCHDMRGFGARPVWFNAWHQEQEEHLLAALWHAIRQQAPPSWWTMDGIAFRLRLLGRSIRRNAPMALLLLFAAAMVSGSLQAFGLEPWRAFFDRLSGAKWGEAIGALPGPLAQLGAVGAILVALSRALTAFGTSPGLLARAALGNLNLRQASLAVGARARFEREFSEVTAALPQPMLIVIDDLDRCRAETVATVLETVNFLVTCGKCFVVLGMAREMVQRAIGLSFSEIAAETGGLDSKADPAEAGRQLRRQYAKSYLEKLINIEVDVPALTAGDSRRLLANEATGAVQVKEKVVDRTRRLFRAGLAIVAVAGVVATGLWAGRHIEPPVAADTTAVAADPPDRTASAAAGDPADTRRPGPQAGRDRPRESLSLTPGRTGRQHWWVIVIFLLLAVMALAATLYFRLRQMAREVRDSPAFVEALERWGSVLDTRLGTPRSVRRFGNRVRLLAMRQRPPEDRHSIGAEMWHAARIGWLRWRGRSDDEAASSPSRGLLDESTLVALGTLSELHPDRWREMATQDAGTFPDDDLRRAAQAADQPWPVEPEQLAAFEALARGIRVRAGG